MIPIQNVYYMLSYAFQVLNEQGYKDIATEKFNNTAELMAAILAKGIAVQIKRGLGKEYIVRRHIVGGTYRTLISVQNPLRLCRTGICRSLSAG